MAKGGQKDTSGPHYLGGWNHERDSMGKPREGFLGPKREKMKPGKGGEKRRL